MLKITLPDGSIKNFESSKITPLDVATSISKGLAKKAVAAKVDGHVVGLNHPIEKDAQVTILTFDDQEGRDVFRHSASHILAQAVQRLYPGTKLGIGPAIKDGFYYDFDSEHKFTPDDLVKIEEEMEKIIKEDYEFVRKVLPRSEAIKFFQDRGELYKVELIEDLPEDAVISIYQQGDFVDLCAGPHLPCTGMVKAPKLLSVAGAYWRGSEKNKMLQRIYGTAFPKKSELEEYLYLVEEAKRRDHRKLGQELELFAIMDEGPGFPFFFPKGMIIRNELENFWREIHREHGIKRLKPPLF